MEFQTTWFAIKLSTNVKERHYSMKKNKKTVWIVGKCLTSRSCIVDEASRRRLCKRADKVDRVDISWPGLRLRDSSQVRHSPGVHTWWFSIAASLLRILAAAGREEAASVAPPSYLLTASRMRANISERRHTLFRDPRAVVQTIFNKIKNCLLYFSLACITCRL